MRKISIDIFCDFCYAEGLETEGEEQLPIAIGRAKPKVVAVCKECLTTKYDPFVAVISEGAPVQEAPKRKADTSDEPAPSQASDSSTGKYVKCPKCEATRKNPNGISKHLRQDHDLSLLDAIGPDGTLYDVDGDAVKTPKPRGPYQRAS